MKNLENSTFVELSRFCFLLFLFLFLVFGGLFGELLIIKAYFGMAVLII